MLVVELVVELVLVLVLVVVLVVVDDGAADDCGGALLFPLTETVLLSLAHAASMSARSASATTECFVRCMG